MAILVVDDERAVRSGLRSLLELEHYTVHEAKDGVDALSKLAELDGQIEVILLDIKMPNMDGTELVQYLTLHYPHVVGIIMHTAYNLPEYKKEFCGDDSSPFVIKQDYLQKPVDSQHLIDTIKSAISAVEKRKFRLQTDFQRFISNKIALVNDKLYNLGDCVNSIENRIDEGKLLQNQWYSFFEKELARYTLQLEDNRRRLENTNDSLISIKKELDAEKGYTGLLKKIGSDLLSALIIGLAILALFYLGIDDLIKSILNI